MQFTIVIHKDSDSDYGVTVPDLPGCFSAGASKSAAILMAREAIYFHVAGLIEEGRPVPDPIDLATHQLNPDYAGGVWDFVEVQPC